MAADEGIGDEEAEAEEGEFFASSKAVARGHSSDW